MSKPKPNAALMNYQLEGVSRALIEQARQKAKACTPPLSVKHVLISLLTAWIQGSSRPLASPTEGKIE